MAFIKHLLHINASKEKVYEAPPPINGTANWWTKQATGESKAGGHLTAKITNNIFFRACHFFKNSLVITSNTQIQITI